MENRLENPLYSMVHSEVIHSPQAIRQPPKHEKEVTENEEKKTRTRIPISKFKQTVEKVKEQRRNNRDDKQQSRQSAIPRLKDKSLIHAHDTKKPKEDFKNTNHTNHAAITNAVKSDTKNIKDNNKIENGNKNVPIQFCNENGGTEQSDTGLRHTGIPLLVKSNVQKFIDNENKINKQGDSNIEELEKDFIVTDKNYTRNEVSIANDDVVKSNSKSNKADDSYENEVLSIKEENIEINAEELQAIQDFDKIYEDIIDNEEPDSIIDEIVEEIKVDPEKLKIKFEEIVHNYDGNKTQQINVGKIKSKIPLLKQTSLHDLPVSKILERRLSLKNCMQMNDSNTYKTDSGKDCIKIENNKTIQKDDIMPYTPHVEQRTNLIKEMAKEAVSVIDEIKTVNNIETVQYDNNIIIMTEEIKLAKEDKKPDEEPIKEKLKVVTPVFDGTKTVNKIDILKCNNNIRVAEEIKQNKTDSKPIKEISQEGLVFDHVITANNIEIVENNNNMTVTEEIKLINTDKPFERSADKNNDISSKVPGSTKMVQNLLLQMENKNKNEDFIELPTLNQEIEDISTKDNAKVLIKKENNLESKHESKIKKLINNIKTRDQGIKKDSHEPPEDILVNASIKSKIATLNKNKTVKEVKPTKNISPNQNYSELKTRQIVRIPVNDVESPFLSDNGNNLEINLQEINNNNHFTNEHNANNVNYQKPSNLVKNIEQAYYDEPIDANVFNNDLRHAHKGFNQANIIEEPSYTLGENENLLAENSNVINDPQNHIEDYIPKGKVRSIINKIGSNETCKETPKAEVVIELPKKKSVLSRIALFERQSSKEPVKPKPFIEAKSEEVAKLVNHAPRIVNEIEKVHIISEDFNDKYQELLNKELSIDMKPVVMDTEIIENRKEEQNVEFDTNKPKKYCSNKIIAKNEKKIEHRNAKLNHDSNFVSFKKQTKEILQKVDDKHVKYFSSVKEDDLKRKEEIPNLIYKELINTENIEDTRISLLSSPELELGDTKRGKVHEMIVIMNSKENLYQDVEKKEAISIKEMPQKRTVSEKIALFEKKIKPISDTEQNLTKLAKTVSNTALIDAHTKRKI